ncbi:MAG: HAD family hydrolase [Alphaproteobacteria bacterium]|nr:HAD family hydrolase [Alphaproteobacteria bacterium]
MYLGCHAWIFDLDGTLTVPMHDFAGLKAQLGLPLDRDVLAGIETRPEAERDGLRVAVRAWEVEHVENARPAPHAGSLLGWLRGAGCEVGILTRNTRATALETLERIGLRQAFAADDVLGRECASPKPSPAGVLALLGRWGTPPERAVVVGDYVHDLEAGRAAGARTIWLDHDGSGRFAGHADRVIRGLGELLDHQANASSQV